MLKHHMLKADSLKAPYSIEHRRWYEIKSNQKINKKAQKGNDSELNIAAL